MTIIIQLFILTNSEVAMIPTVEQVKKMIPTNPEPDLWQSFCQEYFDKYDINTVNRIAGFFAQGGHESNDFKTLMENLNYSADRLIVVFPRYFPNLALANQYHRQPQKIANRVYNDALRSNKIGNTQEGDGWRFRGRGIFQLTGRWNYEAFGKSIGMTAEEAAAYCGTKRGAFESACWYWKRNNLNRFADSNDIVGMSVAVNGGKIGLDDRKKRYYNAVSVLSASTQPSTTNYRMLMKGSRGEDVKKVQLAFKLADDGIFGNKTESAVRSWQRTRGYSVTGKLTINQVKELIG